MAAQTESGLISRMHAAAYGQRTVFAFSIVMHGLQNRAP